jgi:serine/threonine-protein kinase
VNEARAARAASIAVVSFALAGTPATSARADPSSDNRAAAQVLFERGRELVESNRFAEACPQFAESQRLDPGLGTLLWLADCYENTGQTASAWTAFSQAAAVAAERHDPREGVARARAAKLEATLSRLTIVVAPEASALEDLQIHCDGVVVTRGDWGRPMPLDPGSHTVTANAANHRLWWTTAQVPHEAAGTTVTVPALPVEGSEVPALVAEESPSVASPPPAASPGHAQRVVAIAMAAGGATAVLMGSFFALKAKSRYDESNDGACLPDNECTQAGFDERQSATSMATVATLAMSGGAAVLAGATALYLTAPRGSTAHVAFAPAARGGALDVRWRW